MIQLARDRLLKKWIAAKKDQQLCDVFEMAILLEAMGMPP
jgi:hypothetical protein